MVKIGTKCLRGGVMNRLNHNMRDLFILRLQSAAACCLNRCGLDHGSVKDCLSAEIPGPKMISLAYEVCVCGGS